MGRAKLTNDDGYLDGVALNLHGFYAGLERIFEDIARSLEKTIPTGPTWHQDLLLQMSAEIPHIRPLVITSETRYCLTEYLSFRHVVRNVYTFNLKLSRLQELTDELQPCYLAVKHDLNDFAQFLEQLSLSEDDDV